MIRAVLAMRRVVQSGSALLLAALVTGIPFLHAQAPPPLPAAAPQVSAADFLEVASQEVQKYIDAFGDLTADETRTIEIFDEHGFPRKSRTMTSSLVVYRLQSDAKQVIEYRDVATIDGKPVNDHAERAVKIWQELSRAHSPQEEAGRVVEESERFDYGVKETGLTLNQGLPLRKECRGDFDFHEEPSTTIDGHAVRVFSYVQRNPCQDSAAEYALAVPQEYVGAPFVHTGRLWLDAATTQIVREERNVNVGNADASQWRIAHMQFDYASSTFGLLLPAAIRIEIFYPEMSTGMIARNPMVTRITQSYGSFSRFQVTVGVKNAAAR